MNDLKTVISGPRRVNLAEKLEAIPEHWDPHIVGALNGQHVKLVRIQGPFVWHKHDDADELFYVIKGTMRLRFRDRDIVLRPGEFCIVPRGVEHMPEAAEEVHLMLFETEGTLNTGDAVDARTVESPKML